MAEAAGACILELLAVLIVAVKLFYGLDGQARDLPACLPAPPIWREWAEDVFVHLTGPLSYPLSLDEVGSSTDPGVF